MLLDFSKISETRYFQLQAFVKTRIVTVEFCVSWLQHLVFSCKIAFLLLFFFYFKNSDYGSESQFFSI